MSSLMIEPESKPELLRKNDRQVDVFLCKKSIMAKIKELNKD
ncbi:hypothetical protein [Duffyella gerundensis]|nr:hypothetical protein [Duffyella gerundensis]